MRTPGVVGVVCLALAACVGVESDPTSGLEHKPLRYERWAVLDAEDVLRTWERESRKWRFLRRPDDFCLVSGQCDPEPRFCLSSLDLCDEDPRLEPLPLDPPGQRPE